MQRCAGHFAQRFSISKTGCSHEEFGNAGSAFDGDLWWSRLNPSHFFDLHFCTWAQFKWAFAWVDRVCDAWPFGLGFGYGRRAHQWRF
jgi:hypothetical protein